ncbi:MAG TPA: hypothetical protein VFQ71_01660 [Gaiellales bacterium]|jgi:hypothetical protein|nr:hypothetical protein [Gaiellales bacterium]
MSLLRRFAAFWWDFVVGEDWRVAAGLAVALIGTWVLEEVGVDAWWALPVAVSALLVGSILREASRQRHAE